MKNKLKLHFLFLAILGASTLARAQGTAFTYQGRLNVNGSLANGDYDLKFSIFDDPTAGSQVGDSLTNATTSVSNGLFTVTLDFGGGVFTGDPRWLQIGVTTNGSGEDFTALSLRQALTASPYAIFAGTSANVASGSVVTGLNGLKDDVTLQAGTNVTITPSGNTLTIASAGAGGSGIWSVFNNNAYYPAGNVGIGTDSPISKLHIVSGASDLVPPRLQSSGTTGFSAGWDFYQGAVGKAYVGVPDSAAGFGAGELLMFGGAGTKVSLWSAGARRLTVDTTGNVGIGTSTPASKLTVFTPSGGLTRVGMEHTDGTIRLGTYVVPGFGGMLGTVSDDPLSFFCHNNYTSPSMTINDDGSITMASGPGFVSVGTPNAESGTSIKRGNNRADVRFNGSTLKLVAAPGSGPPPSTYGIAVATNGNVGIGTEAPLATLDVRGTTRTCVLTITGGCDLAEPFPMDASDAPKGSVVVIDEENSGRLKLSDRAYDTRVAGIVSGANGINPGISLRQEGALEGGQNVALSGRVYVRADAAFGAIKPGDLLTTSDTPGHAMRVTEHGKAQGAILGKAMSSLDEGTGMVLVLVTLQ
jgi:hypothetical protein